MRINNCAKTAAIFLEKMANSLEEFDVEDLAGFLLSKGVPSDIIESFKEHGINGQTFVQMSEEHIKELAPRIVDRVNLKKIASNDKVRDQLRLDKAITKFLVRKLLQVICLFHLGLLSPQ